MSVAGNNFRNALGVPDPRVPSGLGLEGTLYGTVWEELGEEIGAGWFLNRFAYLFGEGIHRLLRCVEDWSFLCPSYPDRRVIGRNAYGALLVADGLGGSIIGGKVWLLDPTMVMFSSAPDLDLIGLVADWLPHNRLPSFLDRRLYDELTAKTGQPLGDDDILALKVPIPLGGTMTLDNIQVENIFSYYQTTAPIYARAIERIRDTGRKPPRRKR